MGPEELGGLEGSEQVIELTAKAEEYRSYERRHGCQGSGVLGVDLKTSVYWERLAEAAVVAALEVVMVLVPGVESPKVNRLF